MAWELTGNTGTNPASNFLGTTDQRPVVIKTNNKEAVRVNPDGPASKVEIAAADGLAVTGDRPFITLRDANAGNAHSILQCLGGDMALIPNNPGGAIVAMVLKANTGNVGIGTLNPSSKVEIAAQASQDGVTGKGTTGKGVVGLSVSEHGVFGQSQSSRGVGGISVTDIGVFGVSASGEGVRGQSETGTGVIGQSNGDPAGGTVFRFCTKAVDQLFAADSGRPPAKRAVLRHSFVIGPGPACLPGWPLTG